MNEETLSGCNQELKLKLRFPMLINSNRYEKVH